MSLSGASIRRPVAMSCLIIGLTLLGLNAYRKMGVEFMPKVDVPYVTVVTVYPGASPGEIESDVAKRIEDAVVSIDGLKHVSSSCMENVCQTLLEFEIEIDVDVAANDIRDKLDLIANDLPETAETPKVLKYDINAKPIVTLALKGSLSTGELYDYADNTLRDRLSVIQGVADVQVLGGSEQEVQVLLDRAKLAERGLASTNVIQAIQGNVRTIPAGRVRDSGREFNVKFDAEYDTVEELATLEIANLDGARVYLGDVATVSMGSAELRQTAFVDGTPCIGIRVIKKADANAVRVVNRVREEMGGVMAGLPGGMELVWVSDDGAFIESSVDSAISNTFQGVALTALILFLFLYNIRTTLIVTLTMPLTIIISLFFLQYLDYTLNTSTLLALGLSVGILVTNSIVVLESITKRFSEGMSAREAAEKGARDVGLAVLASAGTNIVVLFPIIGMGSIIGRFFRPFAVTMVVVTFVSLFISFTLTPILCAYLLKRSEKKGLLHRAETVWNAGMGAVSARYAAVLRYFEKRRWAAAGMLVFVVLLLGHALWLASTLGSTFVADSDQGQVFVKLEYPTSYDLEQTTQRVLDVEKMLSTVPGLSHVYTTIGKVEGVVGQSSEGVHLAQILLRFVEKTERAESMPEILSQVREMLTQVPGCIATVNVADIIGGQGSPVELVIAGPDLATLDTIAERAVNRVQTLPGIKDPDSTVRAGKPELRILPLRPVLAELNVPATSLGLALRGNLEGIKAGIYKEGARSYDIRVKFAEEQGKDQVEAFQFPAMPGNPVMLGNFARVEEGYAPVQITRSDKQRIAKLFANLGDKMPLGTAAMEISSILENDVELPAGYSYAFRGEYEIMEEATEAFVEAGIIAVLLTYLTLAGLLESFRQPFIILLTLPLGLIGVVWALYAMDESISMFVLLGAVMLVGIVVNNAILVMEQVNQLTAQGIPRHQAMIRASQGAFRPVVMITLAAMLGMLPLAFGTGIGSELRTGIGISSVGGIAISAVLTLVVIPIVYDLFTRRERGGSVDAH
ncbi:MAG: efflux RND transporter permease subunit [Candidatus Hydrogenedentes bacterium]|nr:efflux RND transporter permease subunit [Candidatus Hydrogenedentota bacterium]